MDAGVQAVAGTACASAPVPTVDTGVETPPRYATGGYVPRPRAIRLHEACVFHLPCPPPVKVA